MPSQPHMFRNSNKSARNWINTILLISACTLPNKNLSLSRWMKMNELFCISSWNLTWKQLGPSKISIMVYKLSLAHTSNVLQQFMTFHLHCFHFSFSTLSAQFRFEEPSTGHTKKKKKKKSATSKSFILDTWIKEDSLCYACRSIEIWC